MHEMARYAGVTGLCASPRTICVRPYPCIGYRYTVNKRSSGVFRISARGCFRSGPIRKVGWGVSEEEGAYFLCYEDVRDAGTVLWVCS